MADAQPEVTALTAAAPAEVPPAPTGAPPAAPPSAEIDTGVLEVEMRGLSATMVEVTAVKKEDEVTPLPPATGADPESLGQIQLDTLIQIQNGIAKQCSLQEASLRAQMVGSKMVETLSKLMGARSQSLEREMKTMLLYLEKEMNVGQNVMDSVEATMDKVTEALGGFATSVGTLADTLKDMAANQRTAQNVGDDQQKRMVSELGQCREMLVHVRNNTKESVKDLKNCAWQMSELRSGATDQSGAVTSQAGSMLYLKSEDLKTSCQATLEAMHKSVTAIQNSIEQGVHPEKSHKRKLELAHEEEEKQKREKNMLIPMIHPYTGARMYLNQEQQKQFLIDLQSMGPEQFGKGGTTGAGTATGSEPSGGKGGYAPGQGFPPPPGFPLPTTSGQGAAGYVPLDIPPPLYSPPGYSAGTGPATGK